MLLGEWGSSASYRHRLGIDLIMESSCDFSRVRLPSDIPRKDSKVINDN